MPRRARILVRRTKSIRSMIGQCTSRCIWTMDARRRSLGLQEGLKGRRGQIYSTTNEPIVDRGMLCAVMLLLPGAAMGIHYSAVPGTLFGLDDPDPFLGREHARQNPYSLREQQPATFASVRRRLTAKPVIPALSWMDVRQRGLTVAAHRW